jgi:2-polyprenyl-3-methyl-5-hydroxy-6-metoxy-1,4-benzoquinol methylase
MSRFRWGIAQYAEIRWWQNYLKKKPVDGYHSWKTSYWKDFLLKIGVSPHEGSKILDAGCGPAGIFTILDGMKVDALDPLLDRYEEKLDHFSKASYPDVSFICMPLEQFRPERSYDTIFCLNAINHVENLNACLDILVSCLRPGGCLVLSIDAHNYQIFKHIFRLLQGDILHPHQYDLAEYKDMMISRGIDTVREVCVKKEFLFNYYALVCRKPD